MVTGGSSSRPDRYGVVVNQSSDGCSGTTPSKTGKRCRSHAGGSVALPGGGFARARYNASRPLRRLVVRPFVLCLLPRTATVWWPVTSFVVQLILPIPPRRHETAAERGRRYRRQLGADLGTVITTARNRRTIPRFPGLPQLLYFHGSSRNQ